MSEDYTRMYEHRNESLRYVIDVLASYDPDELDQRGAKSRIAEHHDIETHRIYYVLKHWPELVDHRRAVNSDPHETIDLEYEDETLKEMAEMPVTDGLGDVYVTYELSLNQAFRAIKLLPGDLGSVIFTQTVEQADELPGDLDVLFD